MKISNLSFCWADLIRISSLLVLVLPARGHPLQVKSSLQLDVVSAKLLLMSLGVQESNLCIDETDAMTQDDYDPAALLLPLCSRHSDDDVRAFPIMPAMPIRFLGEGDEPSFEDDPWFYVAHAACALACVVTAALAAGLTMGLLSLDPLMLLIKMRAGATQKEKDQASSLLPIVKQHHLLLVTLLLLNAMANEALPLFLEVLVSPVMAVILSVTLVLFFGEIIPSAIFTGPQKIELASKLVPLVRLFMFLLWPVAYPIGKLLDIVLHEDNDIDQGAFNRGELSALVRIQYEERLSHKRQRKLERAQFQRPSDADAAIMARPHHDDVPASLIASRSRDSNGSEHGYIDAKAKRSNSIRTHDSHGSDDGHIDANTKRSNSIHIDEVSMIEGALQMKTKVALDVLTPLHRMFAVPYDMILTEDNVVGIYSSGYSRIPVYEPNPDMPKNQTAIRGLLMTKHLIVVNTTDDRPISTLPLLFPPCVSPKMNLVDLLNLFQTGKSGHCALVCARPKVAAECIRLGHPLPPAAGLMG